MAQGIPNLGGLLISEFTGSEHKNDHHRVIPVTYAHDVGDQVFKDVKSYIISKDFTSKKLKLIEKKLGKQDRDRKTKHQVFIAGFDPYFKTELGPGFRQKLADEMGLSFDKIVQLLSIIIDEKSAKGKKLESNKYYKFRTSYT